MGGCPFHADDGDSEAPEDRTEGERTHQWSSGRSIDRRAFLKSAVAIGGMSALTAAMSIEADGSDPSTTSPDGDPSNRPPQQHRWSDAGYVDEHGNPAPPTHQIVLLLDYAGDDIDADRARMEASFRQLEEAFAYNQSEGLLFNVGYSPAYFKRYSTGQPKGVDITEPRAVSPYNNPEMDRQDIFLQLASDRASVVLAAEAALEGNADTVNGVSVENSLAEFCVVAERRSVFAGPGLPKERLSDDVAEHIDETSPLSMGYNSVYADSIPPEQRVTISEGPWMDGTVAMVSKLRLKLREWYEERTEAERVQEMFAPDYTPEDVGDFGEGLGEGSGRGDGEGWSDELTDQTEADAREKGIVGHSQKVSRARDDDFGVKLLRRDGDITVAGGKGGLSFVGLVEGISDWFDVADAMYDPGLDGVLRERDDTDGTDGHHPRSGISARIDVLSRGHFLVPPRSLRALPPSRP
ncbi:Tat pathway signal protein [Haloarcula sp. JP-L23]|uniref:DUF7405 family protein n=1 Tax=Haloarcula sp. JP-L23 TaxID=2716717 RepID=UPI00140F2885|nr:Tat pathway signal protein [Haloarcula sp. JP-L23]